MKLAIAVLLAAACTCGAADKKTRPTGEAGNDNVDIYATPLLDRDQIKAAVGRTCPPASSP